MCWWRRLAQVDARATRGRRGVALPAGLRAGFDALPPPGSWCFELGDAGFEVVHGVKDGVERS